jgi:hypothetical protein
LLLNTTHLAGLILQAAKEAYDRTVMGLKAALDGHLNYHVESDSGKYLHIIYLQKDSNSKVYANYKAEFACEKLTDSNIAKPVDPASAGVVLSPSQWVTCSTKPPRAFSRTDQAMVVSLLRDTRATALLVLKTDLYECKGVLPPRCRITMITSSIRPSAGKS